MDELLHELPRVQHEAASQYLRHGSRAQALLRKPAAPHAQAATQTLKTPLHHRRGPHSVTSMHDLLGQETA